MKAIITIEDSEDDSVKIKLEFDPPVRIKDAVKEENSNAAILAVKALTFLTAQRDEGTEIRVNK